MPFRRSGALVACLLLSSQTPAWSAPSNSRDYYEARNEIVWEVPTKEKVIALTFDDGPDSEDTPAILDLLRQYEAKATFFVVGKRVEEYPDLVIRESLEGHEIANHTYSHPYFNRRDSSQKIRKEMEQTNDAIVQVTGQQPHLFRPPGGYYSEQLVRVSKYFHYRIVLWSWHQDTEDWNKPGVDKIVNKVLNNARNGDIALFHDHVQGSTQTIAALERILPELKRRGFRFVTVSELLSYKRRS
ncbi:polysaccharide deacetylase family protein [Cohnella panacarvi]|uniref:polysaccharide deacetylase family protein n=1 Tax=Cohnella panacarvi TaxID=400776 RepID=UPI000479C16C|nr:polysaccharide deacetylase family protein [Cohnella panacarvi]